VNFSVHQPSTPLSSGRLLFIVGPLLALGGFTALLAAFAALFGWYPHEMMPIAAGVGAVVTALALALAYRFMAQRKASVEALHNIEARISGIVDSAMDAIITADEQQRIMLFNAAAEKVFLWPRAAVLGQPLEKLIPERYRARHGEALERFGLTGQTTRHMGGNTMVTGMRADGSEFPAEASISQVSENDRKLFTVILRDITERVRTEEALRRSQLELRQLATAAHSVREQEKARIARELHDELAQGMTAMKMDLTWLQDRLPPGQDALAEKLAKTQATLDVTVAATRRISADLRPMMLDDLGLIPAVEWLVQNFMERTGITCDLDIGARSIELPDTYATAIFRILQESLTNAARHAQASLVEINLALASGEIRLTVRDDGRGFSTDDPRKPNSYGLLGLRERAYLLGGEAMIDSAPGRGTTIAVSIPLEQKALQP